MARSRREKTLADYVVIAISPALIMTLVGSLAFFLLEVTYRGQYRERLMWVLFCFVFGAVLVVRIAIEQGRERAHLFGLALGGATAFFAFQFLDWVLVAWGLLAVIWWCSWKLVFDCTLIDEDEDSSGEGLLQAAGFDSGMDSAATGTSAEGAKESAGETGAAESDETTDSPRRRPHAPGLWVVYFSLAALPLFGLGQLFIPAADAARRTYAFQLLAAYVASALGLLLTTSFLGLRRYLRQRKLQMPAAMTRSWLGMGAGLALMLLLAALFIPRPQAEYSLTQLVDRIDQKVRDASKIAMRANDHGQGEGRRVGPQDEQADQPGEGGKPPEQDAGEGKRQPGGPADKQGQGQGGKQGEAPGDTKGKNHGDQQTEEGKQPNGDQGEKGDGEKGQGEKGKSEKRQAEKAGGEKRAEGPRGAERRNDQQKQPGAKRQEGERQPVRKREVDQAQEARRQQAEGKAAGQPGQQPQGPPASQWLASLAPFVKWLIYGALALAGCYLLYRHWAQFVSLLNQLWNELLNLWHSLFGGKQEPAAVADEEAEAALAARLRPFADFDNPFASGAGGRMSPAQLTLYTFEALEAWAREQVVARPPDQTPLEFADELSRRSPALSEDVRQTAQLYVRVVYAKKSPTRDSIAVLERLWRRLTP